MAHSNYKVLTNADLSGNEIYNVSKIVNTEEDSKALSIETNGDTSLKAANLKSNATGETSLTTNTSKVTVTGTATETVTTSKTTTVETASTATKTTEKIDVEGISINTPSQKVTTTGSAKTISPSIVAITEEVENEVDSKGSYSKIELGKTGATATITAKRYTVDADVTGGSITQTAPTSIYKANTDEDNMVKLTTSNVTIKSGGETVQLSKGSTTGSTAVTSEDLQLHATKLTIDENTSITSASSGVITLKSNSAGSASIANGSTLNLTNTEANVSAPTVTIEGKNGTSSENCQVQAKVGSTSITIAPQDIKLDSDGTLHLESDGNAEIKTTEANTSIALNTNQLIEKATTSSKTTSLSITLITGDTEGTGVNKQAKIALTKSANTDDSKVDISAKNIEATAVTGITQTAPTSTYQTDSSGTSKVLLSDTGVTIKSGGTETIALNRSSKTTTLTSDKLIADADIIETSGNQTTTITSSTSITAKATDSAGTTTVTAKPAELSMDSNKVVITGKGASEAIKLIATNTTTTTADDATVVVEPRNIKLDSSNTIYLKSAGNTEIKTADKNTVITLNTSYLTEKANTIKLHSGDITLQPSSSSETEQIKLSNADHTVTAKAGSASVTAAGNNNTVTIAGTELVVDSGSSTFKNNATFNKNVKITGDLATSNMTGEAATLNSLDVTAATTVNGNLTTNGNLTLTDATGKAADLGEKLTVTKETLVKNTATVDTLAVTGKLTANKGLESSGKVTISNQNGADPSLTVHNTASTGTLEVAGDQTLTASGGLVSAGKVSVNGKGANDVSVMVSGTASTGTLTIANTKTLEANGGLVSAGKVDIQNAGSNSGTSLTVNKTATTGALDVTGTLTASNGLTSAGAVKIEKDSSVENALTVNTSASTDTLSVKGGLTANSGMTSNGNITVSGTTSITTLEGAGTLTIPKDYSLEAKNGGTTGSVDVSKIAVNTIDGLGSLTIPNGKTLTADTAAGSTAKVTGDFTPTNIGVNTVKGSGSIEIASDKTLKIDPVSGSEVKVEGNFTPTNISVNTVEGNGSITISSGKTLTVKNNGTVNGSMIVGKAGSTATNLAINGNLTIGETGATETKLTSNVGIQANSTLDVTGKATFAGTAEAKNLILDGVTIAWDSTLGALTFSRR